MDSELENKGFILSPILFNENEIKSLRRICEKYMDIYPEKYPNEIIRIISKKSIYEFIFNRLGKKIFWTGNYEFKYEKNYYPYNLHHDAKGEVPKNFQFKSKELPTEFTSNYRAERDYHLFSYPVYRLFIYLNDYRKASGGTKLKSYSHKKYLFNELNQVNKIRHMDLPLIFNENPQVRAGQAVLFNARVYHSGFYLRYKMFPNISMPTFVDNHFKRLLRYKKIGKFIKKIVLPFPTDRWTIAIDFAYESLYSILYSTDRYYCGNPAIYNLVSKPSKKSLESDLMPMKLLPLNFSPIKKL